MRTLTFPAGPSRDSGNHLSIVTTDPPRPSDGEVLIEVEAVGVNRADILQRQGFYPPPPGAPSWPGLECAGTVVARGPGVTSLRLGDRVAAIVDGGAYAEYVVARAGDVIAIGQLDAVTAAAIPEAACTSWSALLSPRFGAGLVAGESVVIRGGSGGIGTFAIQLAACVGTVVAATARGEDRLARCAELGAQVLIDHSGSSDLSGPLRARLGRGADVVLDVLGAGGLSSGLDALNPDGRLVVIGMQKGTRAELDLSLMLARRLRIIGTTLRSRPPAQKQEIVAAVTTDVMPLVEAGRIHPVIDRVLPFADVEEAHRAILAGEVFGKVILVP